MVLNNTKFNEEFKTLFTTFKNIHDELEKITSEKKRKGKDLDKMIPKTLRLFRVRLRLVIGMNIDFDTTYALTKDEKVKETYIQIIKCSEAWFAYEALVRAAEAIDKVPNQKFTEISQDTFTNKYETSNILKLYNDEIKIWISQGRAGKRKENVINYLHDLSGQMFSRAETLKAHLVDFANKIDTNQELNDFNILAMIYATRNVFVHKGESAFFGNISYKNKNDLLELSYDYLILMMLKAIIYYLNKQLNLIK